MAADCANALLICVIAGTIFPISLLVGWYACVLLVATASLSIWWRSFRDGPPERMERSTERRAILLAAAMACLYGTAIVTVFPHVGPDGQVVLLIMSGGLIAAGALGRATVPPMAFAWMVPLTLSAALALLHAGAGFTPFILILLAIYDAIVVVSVLSMSKMFLARLISEAASAHQEQVVSLLLRDFETHASNWLWECDADGRLSRVSDRMSDVFARPPATLLGTRFCHLLAPPGDQAMEHFHEISALEKRLASPSPLPFHNHIVPFVRDGELRWLSLTAKPILGEEGEQAGWRGVGGDVTDERRYALELESLAKRDPLTGLPNRRHFMTLLADRIEEDEPCALFLIDLDNFKAINDTLGHSIGDRILQMVSSRFASRIGRDGILARLGGDEFALLEFRIASTAEAVERANALLDGLRTAFHVADTRTEIRAGIGIALMPAHGRSVTTLLKNADAALYAAKEAGGGEARIFDTPLGERQQQRFEIISDLGDALKRREFLLHYQPQVDSGSGQIRAFEALLRWRHPEKGMIPPDRFIPIAEGTGQIMPIGAWALEQACRDALDWPDELTVAVNLSAVQLNSRDIVRTVRQALEVSGLPPRRLELEVTESALVSDSAAAQATLEALRDMGIELALDDFGTGYSMLSYLRTFPFDKLKIDRSFVTTLTDSRDDESRAIFRAIIDLAAALNLRTVAEGVDSEDKLSAVRHYGCNDIQGFLVARPMMAARIHPFLADWRAW